MLKSIQVEKLKKNWKNVWKSLKNILKNTKNWLKCIKIPIKYQFVFVWAYIKKIWFCSTLIQMCSENVVLYNPSDGGF